MPRIPKTVWSSLGPVPVIHSKTLWADRKEIGSADFHSRTISLEVGTTSRETQVATLYHELAHIALWDGGAHQQLTTKQLEAVCDAIGAYFGGMSLAECLTIRAPK